MKSDALAISTYVFDPSTKSTYYVGAGSVGKILRDVHTGLIHDVEVADADWLSSLLLVLPVYPNISDLVLVVDEDGEALTGFISDFRTEKPGGDVVYTIDVDALLDSVKLSRNQFHVVQTETVVEDHIQKFDEGETIVVTSDGVIGFPLGATGTVKSDVNGVLIVNNADGASFVVDRTKVRLMDHTDIDFVVASEALTEVETDEPVDTSEGGYIEMDIDEAIEAGLDVGDEPEEGLFSDFDNGVSEDPEEGFSEKDTAFFFDIETDSTLANFFEAVFRSAQEAHIENQLDQFEAAIKREEDQADEYRVAISQVIDEKARTMLTEVSVQMNVLLRIISAGGLSPAVDQTLQELLAAMAENRNNIFDIMKASIDLQVDNRMSRNTVKGVTKMAEDLINA
ncbi:MAG: hypothetical protein RIA09_15940 [Hoeflea sp.]|uniref:hypothetical protein n=1 Tax=Hoeflea sp. TaxID=1940281 RepID=UPI0032EF1522